MPEMRLVPEVGIEPTLSRGKGDFESIVRNRRFSTKFNYLDIYWLQTACWIMFGYLGLFSVKMVTF